MKLLAPVSAAIILITIVLILLGRHSNFSASSLFGTPRVVREVPPPAATSRQPIAYEMPPSDEKVMNVVRALKQRALAGDKTASCRLATDLGRCIQSKRATKVSASMIGAIAPLGDNAPDAHIDAIANMLNEETSIEKMCAGVPEKELDAGYEYQKMLASGADFRFKRWLIFNPLLDRENFVEDISNWSDYRNLANAIVNDMLERQDLENMPALLYVYAPDELSLWTPPYRRDDITTFLALYSIAKSNGVVMPNDFVRVAQMTMDAASPEVLRAVRESIKRKHTHWSGVPSSTEAEGALVDARSSDRVAGTCVVASNNLAKPIN